MGGNKHPKCAYIILGQSLECSPAAKEEEDSYHLCVECEVPRELLLHTDQLMPPLETGSERFEEYKLDGATILKQMLEEEYSWYYECLDVLYMHIITNSVLK